MIFGAELIIYHSTGA